jgi:hypothetical protein
LRALPAGTREIRQRALDAIALARREGIGIQAAARREGVSVDAVLWWSEGSARRAGRGFSLGSADRLYRSMYVYSDGRAVSLDLRGSRVASKVGAYHSAVRRYLETGDSVPLGHFRGVSIGGVELETDLDVLDGMARRGEFDLESIYREVA